MVVGAIIGLDVSKILCFLNVLPYILVIDIVIICCFAIKEIMLISQMTI